MPCPTGSHGDPKVGPEERWARAFIVFLQKKWEVGVGSCTGVGLYSLKDSSGFWALVVVPSCPGPGPGVI